MSEYEINSGGKRYTVQAGSENEARGLVANDQINDAVGGGMLLLLIPIIILGAAYVVLSVVITVYTWHFLSVVGAFILFTVLRNVLPVRSRFLRRLVAFAAACVVVFAGFKVSDKHYYTVVRNTLYNADYVQALSDGSAPVIHSERGGKGKVLGTAPVGVKVKVLGITRDSEEYKITTPDGITGWVETAAFPEDTYLPKMQSFTEMLKTMGDKGRTEYEVAFPHDRELDGLTAKYFKSDDGGTTFKGLTDAAARRAIPVNVGVPLISYTFYELVHGKDWPPLDKEMPDVQIVLKSILYASDCTIITVESSASLNWSLNYAAFSEVRDEAKRYVHSLVLQDLDNSASRPLELMGTDWGYTLDKDGVRGRVGDEGKGGMTFIFPPMDSRHFSLVHTSIPRAKLNPFLRGIAKALNKKDKGDYYGQWDFTDVRVR